jgi:hypothetical protein
VTRVAAGCGGFLLAVLWMDLMFDVQAARVRGGPRDAAILTSIAAYYRRVTSDASPMNRLIAAVMVVTLVVSGLRLLEAVTFARMVALVLACVPIGLAVVRVVPNAVRLGAGADPVAVQADIARAILRDHLGCFAAMAAFTAIQLLARE